jgi:FkbM family methyltransferase
MQHKLEEELMTLAAAFKKIVKTAPVIGPLARRWVGRPRKVSIEGIDLVLSDRTWSFSHSAIIREFLTDAYGLRSIDFRPGDVVIDIGAHVGLESVYLGKRYPHLRIFAFEPIPVNFASLQANLAANDVTNVRAFPIAVTGDGRDVEIWVNLRENSGGGGHDRPAEHFRGRTPFRVPSVTLDQIFRDHEIDRCRLLKIDCEGAEHEILRSSASLSRVDYLSGEFHVDAYLRSEGHSIDGLIEFCAQSISRHHLRIVRDEQ